MVRQDGKQLLQNYIWSDLKRVLLLLPSRVGTSTQEEYSPSYCSFVFNSSLIVLANKLRRVSNRFIVSMQKVIERDVLLCYLRKYDGFLITAGFGNFSHYFR